MYIYIERERERKTERQRGDSECGPLGALGPSAVGSLGSPFASWAHEEASSLYTVPVENARTVWAHFPVSVCMCAHAPAHARAWVLLVQMCGDPPGGREGERERGR